MCQVLTAKCISSITNYDNLKCDDFIVKHDRYYKMRRVHVLTKFFVRLK